MFNKFKSNIVDGYCKTLFLPNGYHEYELKKKFTRHENKGKSLFHGFDAIFDLYNNRKKRKQIRLLKKITTKK